GTLLSKQTAFLRQIALFITFYWINSPKTHDKTNFFLVFSKKRLHFFIFSKSYINFARPQKKERSFVIEIYTIINFSDSLQRELHTTKKLKKAKI
ncbi:MAG: hypothetical protein IKA35_06430, partial [Bacteroidaceae bacterium]|nr:hypothetical protein [Bacteroidaceae bacterium]